jgi:hypothetical protein
MTYPALLKPLCAALAACCIVVAGCSSKPKASDDGSSRSNDSNPRAEAGAGGKPTAGGAVFANQLGSNTVGAARLRVVQLDVYHLVLPLGAVSRSEEFWKHVEEQRVDVGTYDLLRKNGWRIGVAPTNEWPYFRDIIDAHPASSKPYVLSAGPVGANGSVELEMRDNVPYQNIFYFTDENVLHGRTFERCQNLLSITLQQAPRKPGEARVTVCPTVRALHRRFEVSSTTEGEREVRYVHPERLYDLNCQLDIPAGNFLVIAPSPEVKWKTSLGATFLVQDGAAEQLEQVLLMVPRIAELEATPAPVVPASPTKKR